jgi:hypothetical protein
MLLADPPRGVIVHHQRAWTPDDLRRAAMAIGAFEDDESAAKFASAARAAGEHHALAFERVEYGQSGQWLEAAALGFGWDSSRHRRYIAPWS